MVLAVVLLGLFGTAAGFAVWLSSKDDPSKEVAQVKENADSGTDSRRVLADTPAESPKLPVDRVRALDDKPLTIPADKEKPPISPVGKDKVIPPLPSEEKPPISPVGKDKDISPLPEPSQKPSVPTEKDPTPEKDPLKKTASMDRFILPFAALSNDVQKKLEPVVQMGHSFSVGSIAFGPNGDLVLTGSHDGKAILWDPPTGRQLRTFQHTDAVSSVAFSLDGKYVATCGWENRNTCLWETNTGRKVRTFQGQTKVQGQTYVMYAVTLSRDGKYILTGCGDKTAVLYDVETGKQLRVFQGHTASVTSVGFSPDGKYVVTGS